MSIEEIWKVPEREEWSRDTAVAINKALAYLHEKALTVEYTDTAPTYVPYGTFIVFDDGANERIYFKTMAGNIKYVEAV